MTSIDYKPNDFNRITTMKKQLLFIIATVLSLQSFAQITFEEGYFINNDQEKVACLIRNKDWKNNPTAFEYKLSENDQVKQIGIDQASAFGVGNTLKYVRRTVNMESSSTLSNALNYKREPEFKKETLFLRVLVEGEANLYVYDKGNIRKFFYDVNSGETEQLIYIRYRISERRIGENNEFRTQLWKDLKCDQVDRATVEKVKYSQKSLIKLFEKYNMCSGVDYENYEKNDQRDALHLSIRPGISSSSFTMGNSRSGDKSSNFGNKTTFRIGAEAEWVLPFNKNKWSIILEPTYRYYKGEGMLINRNTELDYKSLELPVGVRYYSFLNQKSSVFINAAFVVDFDLGSTIDRGTDRKFDVSSGQNIALGVGYKYNNRYSIEFRYFTPRNIVKDYILWGSDFKSISLILGYTLF